MAFRDAGGGSRRPQFRLPGGWKMPAIEPLIRLLFDPPTCRPGVRTLTTGQFPLPGGELVSICPTYARFPAQPLCPKFQIRVQYVAPGLVQHGLCESFNVRPQFALLFLVSHPLHYQNQPFASIYRREHLHPLLTFVVFVNLTTFGIYGKILLEIS
jgi:hypothetical protein